MPESDEKLTRYKQKRDFRKTPEPGGGEASFDGVTQGPIFVIQKHDASSLHYDFRIEVDGVLKSWAVPKGPSTDPSEKRLAVPTEDHPLEYAEFEGTIPEDEYGGGTVMVWDRGSYENLKKPEGDGAEPKSVAEQYKDGHVTVALHGRKLQGGYSLIRTGKGDHVRWLMVKMKDDDADARRNPTSSEPDSVKTGRSMDKIASEEGDDG